MRKRVYAKADIEKLRAEGKQVLLVQRGDLVTPLARDTARALGITIEEESHPAPSAGPQAVAPGGAMTPAEEKVEAIVKAVLRRLAEPQLSTAPNETSMRPFLAPKAIVTEEELRGKIRQPRAGIVLTFPPGTQFSPSAKDFIKQWRVEIRFGETLAPPEEKPPDCPGTCTACRGK